MNRPAKEGSTKLETFVVHVSPPKSEKQFTLKECLRKIAHYSKKAEDIIGGH